MKKVVLTLKPEYTNNRAYSTADSLLEVTLKEAGYEDISICESNIVAAVRRKYVIFPIFRSWAFFEIPIQTRALLANYTWNKRDKPMGFELTQM